MKTHTHTHTKFSPFSQLNLTKDVGIFADSASSVALTPPADKFILIWFVSLKETFRLTDTFY